MALDPAAYTFDSSQSNLPPAPYIPSMRGQVILLDDVGEEGLHTYIVNPDLQVGDSLTGHWRGRTVEGVPVDAPDTSLPVLDPPTDEGMLITIPKAFLNQIRGGEAFYSYSWLNRAIGQEVESERLICYIDRSAQAASELPVAHVLESHDLRIDYASFPTTGSVVIPPYQAMAVGDVVTFYWQGYVRSTPLPVKSGSITLTENHLGSPLVITLPRASLTSNDRGELDYTIVYKDAGVTSRAPVQRYQFDSTGSADELPPLSIDGHSGGSLDPEQFPGGLRVRCPGYTEMLTGDCLWLQWQGKNDELVLYQYVDTSISDSQRLLFIIPSETARQLGSGTLTWHFSRTGSALRSEPMPVELLVSLKLPVPVVSEVTHEAGDVGYLPAETVATAGGVTLTIPPSAEYPGASVAMHWAGHEPGGATVITRPVSEATPREFHVERDFIAANMGDSEAKRINVFYRATLASGQSQDSDAYRLMIKAPKLTSLGNLVCDAAQNGRLSKQSLPLSLTFSLPEWLFMAAGQLIFVTAYGTDLDGYSVEEPLTPPGGHSVTPQDVVGSMARFSKARRWFTSLMDNSQLRCEVRVSFDGNLTQIPFPYIQLSVVA